MERADDAEVTVVSTGKGSDPLTDVMVSVVRVCTDSYVYVFVSCVEVVSTVSLCALEEKQG